jgi:hypothetical protein
MKKTIAYVDGFNLYHGLLDRHNISSISCSERSFRKYVWLNLPGFMGSFLSKEYQLEKLYYFTAPIRGDVDAHRRQTIYWKALESLPCVEIQKGKYIRDGNRYVEKQTDIKMALQMYEDALFVKDLQAMILLCADSDQIPTLERINSLNKAIEIHLVFPPSRFSDDLLNSVKITARYKTKERRLRAYQFPNTVVTSLFTVTKPVEWN